MKRLVLAIACAAALAACGQGAQRPGVPGGSDEACALIAQPEEIFGAGVERVGYGRLETMAASCQLQSADGARSGEIVISNAESLGAITPEANMTETIEKWDAQTETPLAPIEGLGEDARIATDLPGYQTQIVFRQDGNVVMVSGSSGDAAMTGEQIARSLAQAASQALSAAQ